MEFTVPQFIEREAKIVGPLTFKQFLFIGTAGGICFVSFFILPFSVFIILCLVLIGGAAALALYRKEGIPLYQVVSKSFFYIFRPKVYLWKKKAISMKTAGPQVQKQEDRLKGDAKDTQLKVLKSSKLNELSKEIETR